MKQRLKGFAGLVEAERADIILLQEVARTTHFRVDEWLAARLGMAYVYSRANGHVAGIGFEEGLAVFSRYPLRAPRLRHLSSANPFVRRLALGAVVETPFGPVHAFSAHLGLPRRQNVRQLARLRAWVAEAAGAGAAIIAGDFNTSEHSAQIARARQGWLDTFRQLHPHADGATHTIHWPWGRPLLRHRLDYIFLQRGAQPWRVLEARHRHAPTGPHSDHHAVVVRLAPHLT
jgi:endonuclease/exonuclease/phosphatase family metal-dependent hydrolase